MIVAASSYQFAIGRPSCADYNVGMAPIDVEIMSCKGVPYLCSSIVTARNNTQAIGGPRSGIHLSVLAMPGKDKHIFPTFFFPATHEAVFAFRGALLAICHPR